MLRTKGERELYDRAYDSGFKAGVNCKCAICSAYRKKLKAAARKLRGVK